MTETNDLITFSCPRCGRFCAVKRAFAGRRARCQHCSTVMIVPARSGQRPKAAHDLPLPRLGGFFQNALGQNLRSLFTRESLPYLLLVCFLTGLVFFFGNTDFTIALPGFSILLPFGWVLLIFTTLFFLWYALRCVSSAAMGIVDLPFMDCNSLFDFGWSLVRDSYLFTVAVILSFLPWSLLMLVLEKIGLGALGPVFLLPAFVLFPVLLLQMAGGPDLVRLFRYDLFARLIRRNAGPYLLTVLLTTLALTGSLLSFRFLMISPQMTWPVLLACLVGKLLIAVFTLFALRCVGLFGYHCTRTVPALDAAT